MSLKKRVDNLERAGKGEGHIVVIWDDEQKISIDGETMSQEEFARRFGPVETVEWDDESDVVIRVKREKNWRSSSEIRNL